MSFAKSTLSGTLVADPEKRFTPNTNAVVTNFTISVSKPGDQGPFTVKIACWRGLADAVAEQLHKGDHVLVEGKLMINSYQTPEGVQKKSFEIEAATVYRLSEAPQAIMAAPGSNNQSSGKSTYASAPAAAMNDFSASFPTTEPASVPAGSAAPASGFGGGDFLTEDDIPF